jgi:hypothetical protein
MEGLKTTRANDRPRGGGESESRVDASPLVGTWINMDKTSGGIVRVVLSSEGGALNVRAFGACSPPECDWGKVKGAAYSIGVDSNEAVGFEAVYDFGFMETLLAAYLNRRLLVVDSYNTFKDGSGRSKYFFRDHFRQLTGAGDKQTPE